MNDAPPKAGPDGGAPLREPLTIADAARRAGVHPNTIRRLIRQERVAARLVRGRYGDTWLVESADIDRAVGGHATPGGATSAAEPAPGPRSGEGQPTWSSAIDSPDFLPSGTDLSLDRARALERYTHGLLQPLANLLREREAALESRDTLIRTQAERIGRLERELELIREARVPVPAASPPNWPSLGGPPHAAAASAPDDDLPEHVSTLASQVGRLRAELQLIATALRPEEVETPDNGATDIASQPETTRAADATPDLPPEPSSTEDDAPPAVTPAVTPEELASLFPSSSRGRLVLRPLDGDGGIDTAAAPNFTTHAPDPFAQAEAAVQELRRALAPDGSTPAVGVSPSPATPSPPPVELEVVQTPSGSASRRWWWPW